MNLLTLGVMQYFQIHSETYFSFYIKKAWRQLLIGFKYRHTPHHGHTWVGFPKPLFPQPYDGFQGFGMHQTDLAVSIPKSPTLKLSNLNKSKPKVYILNIVAVMS